MSKDYIIDSIKSIEIKDKNTDIVVIKIDTSKYNVEDARAIYDELINSELAGYNCIGIPTGVDLEVENIDYLINYLEELKK
jgi:hypothetical protein